MYLSIEIQADKVQIPLLQHLLFIDSCLGLQEINQEEFHLTFLQEDRNLVLETFSKIQEEIPFQYQVSEVKDENWNAKWEEDYQPIFVEDYCAIYAPFHERVKEVKHELVINPEMAFGTGHHETTQIMIQLMKNLNFDDKSVLDLGSGTGILAILAAKEGASTIEAIDIDEKAFRNMESNFSQNQVPHIQALLGDLSATNNHFDVILANITKNVILLELQAIYDKLSTKGIFICSGFFLEDQNEMIERISSHLFQLKFTFSKNQWCGLYFEKQ